MRKIAGPVAALLLLVLATACGASGGDEADAPASTTTAPTTTTTEALDPAAGPFVEQLTKGFTDGDDGDLVLPADAASCVAEAWVRVVGVDGFEGADVAAEDLADPDFTWSDVGLATEQGDAMIDAFGACDFDVDGYFVDVVADGLDDDQEACLRRELDATLIRQILVDDLVNEDTSPKVRAHQERIDETCKLPG